MSERAAKLHEPTRDEAARLNGTDFVYVGCKLPNGIILELVPEEPAPPPGERSILVVLESITRSQKAPINVRPGPRVKLNGSNSTMPGGPRSHFAVAQGQHLYGLTRVEKSFWEAWIKRNAELEFVKRGLVFALDDKKDAIAKAKDGVSVTTGLEAIKAEEPSKDPRAPRQTVGFEPPVEADRVQLQRLYDQTLRQQAGVDPEDLS